MASPTLQFLGPLPRLSGPAGEVRLTSRKGLALLAYLAMQSGRPVSRGILAGLLWGDRGEPQARQSLRQTLHTLRRDLGPSLAGLLAIDEATVSLKIDAGKVDALAFAAAANDADPAKRMRCLNVQWDAFLGSFSTGAEAFDDWVIAERHRLDLIATRVFSDSATRLDAAGNGDRAILALERLLQIDPTNEDTHRRLLTLEHRYRGAETALARARSLAGLLRRELDTDPEQATLALVESIRAQNGHAAPAAAAAAYSPPAAEKPLHKDAVSHARRRRTGTDRRRWWMPLPVAAGLALAVFGGLAYLVFPHTVTQTATAVRVERPQPAEPSWQSPRALSQAAGDLSGQGLVAIAVRPFEYLAAPDGENGLIAAMIADDLTTNLSRVPSFRVISQRTMDSYRGRAVDTAVIGAELGVRYLVEGSVSARDGVLRMNVALADTKTRLTVWSHRFERADRQAAQDEIVAGLARELQVEVTRNERAVLQENQDAHALIFKGWAVMDHLYKDGKRALDQAAGFFERALELDPDNQRAQVGIAAVHTHLAVQLLVDDPAPHLSKAEGILQRVLERSPNRSDAFHILGLMNIARRNVEAAMQAFEKTIALNPSHAGAHAQLGRLMATSGRAEQGLELITYAKRLSPRDPSLAYWHAFSGYAKLELGRFDESVADTRLALSMMPWQPRTVLLLVSALSMAGQDHEARRVLSELQEAQPHLTNATLLESYSNPKARHLMVNRGMMRVLETSPQAPH